MVHDTAAIIVTPIIIIIAVIDIMVIMCSYQSFRQISNCCFYVLCWANRFAISEILMKRFITMRFGLLSLLAKFCITYKHFLIFIFLVKVLQKGCLFIFIHYLFFFFLFVRSAVPKNCRTVSLSEKEENLTTKACSFSGGSNRFHSKLAL